MFDWAAEAWKLDAANENDPPQLLESGSADGAGLELDLNSFVDFGSSNIASLQRGRSSRFGDVVVKCARASHKLPPHDVRNEARLMSQLKHPNVCELFNAYLVDDWLILVEPCSPLTLRALLDSPSFLSDTSEEAFMDVTRGVAYQMCLAIAYLEEQGIAHRDICPSNWVISSHGTVKLIDFSVAVRLSSSAENERLEFQLGTGPYRPPELLFGSTAYDAMAVDRWMLGATIAELYTSPAVAEKLPSSPSSDDSFGYGDEPAQAQRKSSLFDGGMSDFTLIGSIFKTLGTPTVETWPDAASLPDFGKFSFRAFQPIDLADRLPLLSGTARHDGTDFIARFLQYPFHARQRASDACRHPFLRGCQVEEARPGGQSVLSRSYQSEFVRFASSLL